MFPHYFAFLITKIEKKKEKDYCEWESNLEQNWFIVQLPYPHTFPRGISRIPLKSN